MKISVCMATYNGGKYIREQIDSILNQDLSAYPDTELEIIISDDMSTDDTIKIVESYNDERIKIYVHQKRDNYRYRKDLFLCTDNFGYALSKATGDYIFLSDQDDIWYPWKLKKSLDMLIQHGGVCATAFDLGKDINHITSKMIYKREKRFLLNRKCFLYGFSLGFTKDMLHYIYPLPIIPAHDRFITYIASFLNRITYVDELCALHRWTGEHNVSSKNEYSPLYVQIYYRIKMIYIAFYRCFLL